MPHSAVPPHTNTRKPNKHTAHLNLREVDLSKAVKIRPKDVTRDEHPDIKSDGRLYLVNMGSKRHPTWEIGSFARWETNEYRMADLVFSKKLGWREQKNHISDFVAVYEITEFPK